MTDREGWFVHVTGGENPSSDKLVLDRFVPSRLTLEITVPGLQSAGEDQRYLGREAIRQAISDLQEALDSPSALAGFPPD